VRPGNPSDPPSARAQSVAPTPAPASEAAAGPPSAALGLATLALPLLAGAVVRLGGLGRQILGGDELHPLRAAFSQPLATLLTTYQAPDTYVPLASLAKLALLAGLPLDERWLRLPSLLAGLAAVVVVPRLAAPVLGRWAALLAAWLFALSPALVLYGRIVRAYAPLVLLAAVGALLAYRWAGRPNRADALGYAGCAALALYTHPVATPTAVAPLAWIWLRTIFATRSPKPPLGATVRLTALLASGLLAVLATTVSSLLDLAARRRIEPQWSGETVHGLLAFFAGSAAPVAIAAFWLLAAAGLLVLARRGGGSFAALLALSAGVQIVGVVVLAPVGVHEPLMFDRYTLTALPFLLLAAAAGLAAVLAPGARFATPAAAAVLVLWTASGPLAESVRWRTSFAHHNDFVTYGCPRPHLDDGAVPAAYRELAALAGSEPVLEAPWPSTWRFARSLPLYAELHRRPVLVGSPERWIGEPLLRLAAVRPLRVDAIAASGARFVIVHRDLGREETQLRNAPCGEPAAAEPRLPVWEQLRREATTLEAALTARYGPPRFADPAVAIWDLAAR
jgi:hypothetical protein